MSSTCESKYRVRLPIEGIMVVISIHPLEGWLLTTIIPEYSPLSTTRMLKMWEP
jgi:hypothetical protein